MAVQHLVDCHLDVVGDEWPFATQHAEEIARSWVSACAGNAKLFNGDMFVLDRWSDEEGQLKGAALRAKFAAYLYWRNAGDTEAHYDEAFASAMVVAGDGGVLLARSVPGTLNAGFYGAPGGLLDARDVDADGRLDVAGAAVRELREETGLQTGDLERQPGFLLAHIGHYLAVTSVFKSALAGDEILAKVDRFLCEQAEPELEAPRVVYNEAELDGLALTPFADLLTRHVLGM